MDAWSVASGWFANDRPKPLEVDEHERECKNDSWSEAAEVFVLSSQEENNGIEEACACRISSDSESESETISPSCQQYLPELYWVKPLLSCLRRQVPKGSLRKLQVVSACSGTLAEGSVLQDRGWRDRFFLVASRTRSRASG